MRIRMMAFLIAATSGSLYAAEPEKTQAENRARSALADGRFELSVTQIRPVPESVGGRFSLDSGFDPQPSRPVGDGRFELDSSLHSKAALVACGTPPDIIFANGFE